MPEPTDAQRAAELSRPGALFADAPAAADLDLDTLFPNPDMVAQQPIQPQSPAPAPQAEEPFLKMETGTLYKTREEAIRGYAEKDRYIAQQKAKIAELEAKVTPAQPTAPQPSFEDDFYDKMANAAQKGDKKAYVQAFADLSRAVLQPYAPLLSEVAREKAIRTAEARTPGIREFMGSETFNQVTERIPLLKQAIDQLQNDPMAAQAQLDQLLELAKLASDGLKAPDLAVQAAQQAAARAQTPARPTLTSTTPTPTPQQGIPARSYNELLQTSEGRKQIREEFERRGVGNVRLDSVGL